MTMPYKIVVLGASAGGVGALRRLLKQLSSDFPVPLILVMHLPKMPDVDCTAILGNDLPLPVREVEDKMTITAGQVFLAPPGYHLLMEKEGTFALDVDPPVNFARPSIDVLFESASEAYGPGVIGIVLSGANNDGAAGMRAIKRRGGVALVQSPDDAEVRSMPEAAMAGGVDFVASASDLGTHLMEIAGLTRHRNVR